MKIRREYRKKLRLNEAGIAIDADVNAVVSANVNESTKKRRGGDRLDRTRSSKSPRRTNAQSEEDRDG